MYVQQLPQRPDREAGSCGPQRHCQGRRAQWDAENATREANKADVDVSLIGPICRDKWGF